MHLLKLKHSVNKTFTKPLRQAGVITLAVLLSLQSLLSGSLNFSISKAAGTAIVVTPSTLNGWSRSASGVTNFSSDQAKIGKGSFKMVFDNGGQKNIRRTAFNGQTLSSIATLSYSSYVESRATGTSVAPLMRIDTKLGTTDTTLVYEPAYNNGAIVGAWQDWDTLANSGKWWSTKAVAGFTAGGDVIANMFNWNTLITTFPSATIKTNGIYLSSGQNSFSAPWTGFVGYVDNVTINDTTYNFEPNLTASLNLDTYFVNSNYKGIGVDIEVDELIDATGVEVKVEREHGDPVIKTNKSTGSVLATLNTGMPAQTTAPIVIQSGTYNEAGSSSWNQPTQTWNSTNTPTSITVTISRSGGKPSLVKTIALSDIGTPFATLEDVMPVDLFVKNLNTNEAFASIKQAIQDTDTANGHVIEVSGPLTITESTNINKDVTIQGTSAAIITATGGAQLFTTIADGVTFQDLTLTKTDNVDQHFIGVQSDNVSIINNHFSAQYDLAANIGTTRALVVSNGVDNLLIDGNSFEDIRQPAYINNTNTNGTISNNYTDNTRGWVVEKSTNFTFTGNTWGTNYTDIAIINGSNPALPNNYTCQIPAIKAANNNATIDDQHPGTCPDTTDPAFAIINPANQSYVSGTQTIEAQITDDSDITKVLMNIAGISRSWTNGSSTTITRSGDIFATTVDTTTLADGPVYVTLRGTDGAGNTRYWNNNAAHRQHVFYVDNTAPQITVKDDFVGDKDAKVFSKISFKLFDGQMADKYDINGQVVDFSNNKWSDANYQNIKSKLIQGQNTITLYDMAGNTTSYTFTYDSMAPSANLVSPDNNAVVNGDHIIQSWSSPDSDVVTYEYQSFSDQDLTTSRWSQAYTTTSKSAYNQADASLWWRVRAIDQAGNAGDWTDAWKLIIDSTAPELPAHQYPTNNGFINTNDFYFDWTSLDDAVEYEFQSSRNPSVDSHGALNVGVWNNKINGTGDQALLTDSSIHSVGASGTWYWQVRAIDAVGNISAWTTPWKMTIDMEAPTTPSIIKPVARQWLKSTPIVNQWTAASDNNAVDHYQIAYNYDDGHVFGGTNTCPSLTIAGVSGFIGCRDLAGLSRSHQPTLAEEGGVSIWVRAVDKAGNYSPWSSSVHYYYDHTTPTTDINVSSVVNGTFTVSGQANDNLHLNRVYVQLVHRQTSARYGGTTINLIPQGNNSAWSQTYDANTLHLPDGDYAAHVSVVDMAGNSSTAGWTANFTVDTTAPVAPTTLGWTTASAKNIASQGYTNEQDGIATWNASPSSDVDHYIYKYWNDIDSSPYHDQDSAWTTTASNPSLAGTFNQGQGTHHYCVIAVDHAGNQSACSQTFSLVYDNATPALTILQPLTDQEFLTSEPITVQTTTQDNIDINRVVFYIKDRYIGAYDSRQVAHTFDNLVGGASMFTIPANTLPAGQYKLIAKAFDEAGNLTTVTQTIVVNQAEAEQQANTPSQPDEPKLTDQSGDVLGESISRNQSTNLLAQIAATPTPTPGSVLAATGGANLLWLGLSLASAGLLGFAFYSHRYRKAR